MKIDELFELICPESYKNTKLELIELPEIEALNGRSPMAFSVLGDEERKLYIKLSDKTDFVGSSESIKIYNTEVDSYYSIIKEKDVSGLHDIVMKKLRKYCNSVPAGYVYLSHMLLHELGHYQQYIDREKNVFLYTSWCEEEERANFSAQQVVYNQMQSRIDKHIPPFNANKSEKVILERLSKEYRNIPKEKEADCFAYKHLKQAIDTLIVHL